MSTLEPSESSKEDQLNEVLGQELAPGQPVSNEAASKAFGNSQFWISLGIRLVCFAFSLCVSVLFVLHYPGADIKNLGFQVVSLLIGAVIVTLPYLVVKLYRLAKSDRKLSTDTIISNWYKVITKPLTSYLFWTYLFFLFPNLGKGWLTFSAAGFILFSSFDMKFREQKSISGHWSDIQQKPGY